MKKIFLSLITCILVLFSVSFFVDANEEAVDANALSLELFSKYYNECQIIVADDKLKFARLALVKATGYVLKNGLNMLGINAPEKM